MKSRFLPYATTPARLTAQVVSDLLVAAWITVWVLVGLAVHHAIAAIAGVGTQVKDGATGISDNLSSAGDSADRIPLVGDAVATPLRAASDAALDLAGAGTEPQHHRDVAGGAARDRGGRPADPRGGNAVVVPAYPVLPAQMDGDLAGADPGR